MKLEILRQDLQRTGNNRLINEASLFQKNFGNVEVNSASSAPQFQTPEGLFILTQLSYPVFAQRRMREFIESAVADGSTESMVAKYQETRLGALELTGFYY